MVELEQKMKKSLKYTDDICKTNDKSNIDSFFFDDLKAKSYLRIREYLKKDGFQYVPGGYLILDFNLNDNELDSIGKIKKIFVVDGNYVFYVQLHLIRKFHKN
jgi:hypothetical protein